MAMSEWPRLVPELIVSDLQSSLAFWRGLIGFKIAYQRPEERFACLDLRGARVMLEERSQTVRQWMTGELSRPFGQGINFQIEVDAVAPILARLAEAKWPLFMQAEEKWYRTGDVDAGQRQFNVQDPDGYLLRLCEDLGERPIG
jgi:catechol 2,3-dioxygenase-like lactoylglutathione lyase family enzyme